MCIFTILKLVISLNARKIFWFYSSKGSLFHVYLVQSCIFLIQSCIEVTSIWTRVWHNMMHRCLILKRAQYDNFYIFIYFDNVLICLKMSLVFLSLPQRQHKMHIFRNLQSTVYWCSLYINQPVNNFFEWCLFLILFTCVHIKKAKIEICSRMFYPVITATVSTWFISIEEMFK